MSNPFSLDGKTVLITGASSGIGRQTSISVAAMGGKVVATGRNEQRLAETLAMLAGEGHRAIPADLTDSAARAALTSDLPALQGIVHCAGITKLVPFQYLTEKHLQEVWRANYEAAVLLTQILLKKKLIADGGSIVFVASTAGLLGAKAITAYAASKAALIATSRVLALEVAPRRVRSNCLAPALVQTPMAEETSERVSAETFAENLKLYPLGFGKPEDVANAAVFLLSDASRWITGATLVLDGGCTIQ
jgi:NAD(P)-dependent dehydrogenase (short-subunit alcohol dehydrogenase family)